MSYVHKVPLQHRDDLLACQLVVDRHALRGRITGHNTRLVLGTLVRPRLPAMRAMAESDHRRRRPSDLVGSRTRPQWERRYSRLVARTARRDVISLLIEKQVTYSEDEADALVAKAKRLAKESGRTVRAEAELLLRDRETRLRDLQNKVVGASELLAAITVELNDLRAESGDDDAELAAIMATMATSCEPFTSVLADGSISTTKPGESPASSAPTVVLRPIENVQGPLY